MAGLMYLGAKANMKWVPAPLTGPDLTPNQYVSENPFLRGSQSLFQSVAGARQYPYEFGLKTNSEINHLLNTASGAYGQDVYFLDPFAMNTNVLPIHWSQPWMAAYGAPNLMGKDKYKQALTPTTSNTFDYPTMSAVMGLDAGNATWSPGQSLTLWIPVPSGYTFHFGAHSNTAGASNPYIGITPDGGSETAPVMLANNTSTLTNYTYTPGSNSGVTLKLNGNPALTSSISGMVAQVLPAGTAAPTGSFIAGKGHSGCRFVGPVRPVGVSTYYGQQYSATLKEYGNWVDD